MLSAIGYTVSMMVLFGLILALGMLVDNAIVTVENIYRYIDRGYSKFQAAKLAVGEIAIPIIASTATTLAAFIPLIFWKSTVGEFMKILPMTLIIVLTSSLFVALVIIPVISAQFSKKDAHNEKPNKKRIIILSIIFAAISIIGLELGSNVIFMLFIIAAAITISNLLFLHDLGQWFQNKFLVKLENLYLKVLRYSLRGKKPGLLLGGTFVLLVLTIVFYFASKPKILFFPDNNPTYININAELPVGTDITKTDSFMFVLENKIETIIEPYHKIVKSVLTNVGNGAIEERSFESGKPNKGLVTVSFKEYEFREGISTSDIMKDISKKIINKYPGVLINVTKSKMGPPTGKPINLEITGKEFNKLIELTDTIQQIIEAANIDGIEGLKWDMDVGKPEMIVTIDREKARRFGLSTIQIAGTIRNALFGKDISDFKIGEEEYPIQLRMKKEFRNDVSALMNQKIIFRNTQGKLMKVPISAVADFKYSTTYGSVKRKDLNRAITLYSNVLEGYNATEINSQIADVLKGFDENIPSGYGYKFTGEQKDQQESQEFLMSALLIALALILIILVTQFNSLVKPVIILFSVLFSTIGVFGGLATFNMDFVVIMTGIGIVSLAGIVVNNAIVLIDYIEQLRTRKRIELGLGEKDLLPLDAATECIIQGGKTRLRPVLLTAITTILGLIPMAIGMNIDFNGLLTDFAPNIYFGGEMVKFWGPMSWTIIFGLTFSTFLTLVIVPVMYKIFNRVHIAFVNRK
ncbi:MAG: efflux RND transporter permease subunit [Saprospiraceae bacterium]|nr:efflux RND transporter permease subunit [Saprospiraceae bacterium]